jgi:hypothetical protein
MSTVAPARPDVRALRAKFVEFLETNTPPEGLFADDVFLDATLPQWRLQADTVEGAVAVRLGGHPYGGKVVRHRFDPYDDGFVIEVEEEWTDPEGESWYCRELFRADVGIDGRIVQLSVYCTGDWDAARVARHKATVTLIRP